jgi:hypothetical protein
MTDFLALYIVAGVIAAGLAILILVLTCLDRRRRAMLEVARMDVEPYTKQYLLQSGAPISWWALPFWNSE